MKKMIVAAFAAIAVASLAAPIPQASQAWVNMRLEQMKSEVMAYIDAGLSNTNLTETEIADNAATVSISSAAPLATLLSTPVPYIPNPTGTVRYVISGCASEYTNSLPYGLTLIQKTPYTWGTNDVLLTVGLTTNTLTFSNFTLTAPTNDFIFSDGGSGWAIVAEVKE